MKRIRHLFEASALKLACGLLGLLSIDAASNLGGFVGRTLGPVLPVSERARRNLRLVFPDKTEAEHEQILRGMWDNLGRVIAEYPHLGRITDLEAGRVEWVNMDPLFPMCDGRRPVIFASAHLGNWEIMQASAARHGVHTTIIVREPNNPLVQPIIDRLRGVAGGARAPKGAAGARTAIQVLRSKAVLGLLYDQKMSDGVSVPLFGIESMTAAAPAQLALRFGCHLVPIRIERTGPGRFRFSSSPPIELPDSGDRQADTLRIMSELNQVLEHWIRDTPEQWLWLHRRWPDHVYRDHKTT